MTRVRRADASHAQDRRQHTVRRQNCTATQTAEPHTMSRNPRVSQVSQKESRIDSGNALSDPNFPSSGRFPDSETQMPDFRNHKRDFSVFKAHYEKGELPLQQPDGFPIIPFPSTLARVCEEADMRAMALDSSRARFEIFEDAGDGGTCETTANEDAEMMDAEAEETINEREEEEAHDAENKEVKDENIHQAHKFVNTTKITRKQDTQVDTRGRTRAAASRRKALEAIQLGDHSEVIVEEKEEKIEVGNSKKRTRECTQRSMRSRKKPTRKSG